MRVLLSRLWRDDVGALLATEWVFFVTLLVIGLVVGLNSVQKALLNELEEIAGAIGAVSQSYNWGGASGCCGAFTNGSSYSDTTNTFTVDTCTAGADDVGAVCPD